MLDRCQIIWAMTEVTNPGHFFVAPALDLIWAGPIEEEIAWEIYLGRALDSAQTRERRRFTSCSAYVQSTGRVADEPLLSVKWDSESDLLHVTRAVLCYAHVSKTTAGNVVETEEARKWQRELVGTISVSEIPDESTLREELARLVFEAVVGQSRLPLTSLEAPLPAYSLGQLAYLSRRQSPPKGRDPLRSVFDLFQVLPAGRVETAKHLELILRAAAADDLPRIARGYRTIQPAPLAVLRTVFNGVSLSPYTDFVAKTLRFVRELEAIETCTAADRADFLTRVLCLIGRHLTAFDLLMFHHRGANYPDALLVEDVLAELAIMVAGRPDLFGNQDDSAARLRRRGVRVGWMIRDQYTGHAVPDQPTSPGENLRVLPPPFDRVPDDQIFVPARRTQTLFARDAPMLRNDAVERVLRLSFEDLTRPDEILDLGTAVFLDRPLGRHKKPGEPDRTPMLSYIAFSRKVARDRLDWLAGQPGFHLGPEFAGRCRQILDDLEIAGVPLTHLHRETRPGVVSIEDAFQTATDWILLRTTRNAVREFLAPFDLKASDADPAHWRLIVPVLDGGTEILRVFDRALTPWLELAIDDAPGFRCRGGVEIPADGLQIVRTRRPSVGDEPTAAHENEWAADSSRHTPCAAASAHEVCRLPLRVN